jgi:hypothetical protein
VVARRGSHCGCDQVNTPSAAAVPCECHECRRPPRKVSIAGSLTAEQVAIDLKSSQLSGDARLQEAFDNVRMIRYRERSKAFAKVQRALLELGYIMSRSIDHDGEPDGIYGDEMARVIRGFQWRQGLDRDGIVGRATLGELDGLITGDTPPGTPAATPQSASIVVKAIDIDPARYTGCGSGYGDFRWVVRWDTNARNGYIVQEISKSEDSQACDKESAELTTSRYWEAWRVQQDGSVHPVPDTWGVPVTPARTGRWGITGRVFFVNQLDPAAGFTVANPLATAGSLMSTTTQPQNLGPELLRRTAGGEWDCCNGHSSHVPAEGAAPTSAPPSSTPTNPTASSASQTSPQSPAPAETMQPLIELPPVVIFGEERSSKRYTQCDFIDPRISTGAQQALYELHKRETPGRSDALCMLGAVKQGLISGIYKADERKPAVIAVQHGSAWWLLIPSGRDATVFQAAEPPMMVFRPGLADDRVKLAGALREAWLASPLNDEAVIIPEPSGQPCPINLPPTVIVEPRPKPPAPGEELPDIPSCNIEDWKWESFFPGRWNECDIIRSNLEIVCGSQHNLWCTVTPWLCLPECVKLGKIPRAQWNEDCVMSEGWWQYTRSCIPMDLAKDRERLRRRYRRWRATQP